MPLPTSPETIWPPDSHQPMLTKQAEWAAWYSGEPSRIIDVYAATGAAATNSPVPWWRFWSRARAAVDGAQRAQLHVPIASDLAGMSGALLMGEAPRIRIRAAREQEPVAPAKPPPTIPDDPMDPASVAAAAAKDQENQAAFDAEAAKPPPETPEEIAENRLLEIAERSDLFARLVEAAESAAAIGGVYIYPAWDKSLMDVPFMAIAQADNAIPEFRHGYLVAVTFWRVLDVNGNRIIRHLERHEMEGEGDKRHAVVFHAMYEGSPTKLGNQIALDPLLVGDVAPRVDLPIPYLDVRYVPNIRPNRLFRASGQGVADIQGSETLLDALDETYASWVRDVRLAKARILVPREYLRTDPDSGRPAFDVDQEIYVGMDMDPGLSSDARAMLAHQFQIRHEAHRATADHFIERITSNAGYEVMTDDPGNSGAAVRVTQRKTLLTLKHKSAWWRAALQDVLYGIQLIDKDQFGGPEPIRPTVVTADSLMDSPLELAQTALALKTAEAASTETRVRLVNPDWSNAEVMAEVRRIEDSAKATQPAMVAGAAGQPGGFGNPDDDPAATGNKPTTGGPAGQSDNPSGGPPKEPTSGPAPK